LSGTKELENGASSGASYVRMTDHNCFFHSTSSSFVSIMFSLQRAPIGDQSEQRGNNKQASHFVGIISYPDRTQYAIWRWCRYYCMLFALWQLNLHLKRQTACTIVSGLQMVESL